MRSVEEALAEVSIHRIRQHVQALQGVRHPTAAPAQLEEAALYIENSLHDFGYLVERHLFTDNGSLYPNIIATRPGSVDPMGRVLVVAHFDTVSTSPGADDNASGVAVLLELAQVLSSFEFQRTLHFVAVNLEENAEEDSGGFGTRGSLALAEKARNEGWEIAGVVVLESVAFASESVPQRFPAGLPVEVPARADFLAVIGNNVSRGMVQAFAGALQRYRISLPFVPLVVPGKGEDFPDTRRSDHAPFWDLGFPAIMLTDTTNFRNPHYHQPGDTWETLNFPFAAEVCRGTAGLLADLAVTAGATA